MLLSYDLSDSLMQLKSLYVALTRARENVWIADCSDKGEPMRVSNFHVLHEAVCLESLLTVRHSGHRGL